MTLIAVLIVVSLEFYFRWGAQYRKFDWFERLHDKLENQFDASSFWPGWGGVALVLLLPTAALWLIVNTLGGALYPLMLFVLATAVLFLTLGPKDLLASCERYFQATEKADKSDAYELLQQENTLDDIPQSDDPIRNVTRFILVESQVRYFGVIFWFIFLGPCGALFYRLSHLYQAACKQNANDEHLQLMTILLHWLEWLPARLTSLLFLLTGDFMKGFYRVKDYFADLESDNQQLISETGIAALGIEPGAVGASVESDPELNENQQAMALVQRTVIIYLVVVAVLSPLAFIS